jgi:5'-3' exonuclease
MFLILDGNNLAWAGYYPLERAMKPEDDERRHRVAMLGLGAGILGTISRAAEPPGSQTQTKVTRVAICFDEGRPLRRRQMYSEYQMGRERDPKFIANEPTILRAIAEFSEMAACCLPVEILRWENTEADDLIAGLVQANPKMQKRIVSTDRDFMQLIGPKTSIYAPVKKLIIDESNFDECARPSGCKGRMFPRERYLDYRALTGDPSDTLPGVPGVGTLSAVALLVKAPLDSYFGKPMAVRTALGRKSGAAEGAFHDGTAQAIVERNRELMDLRIPAPSWSMLDKVTTRGTWDKTAFEKWFADQRFSAVEQASLFARLETLAAAGK